MNHKIYEDWLFADLERSEEVLTPQEVAAWQDHLQDCEPCRQLNASWREVQGHLRAAPMVAPAFGFTRRWQQRLEAERRRLERRQTLALLGFGVAGVTLLFGSLLIMAWPMFQSPSVYFWTWLYRTLTLASYLNAAGEAFGALFQSVTGVIPIAGWIIFVGLLCELGVLWIVSYRVLTNPRRITIK